MAEEHLPADPRRIQAFARFFKNYMSVSSFVVAALPIPITSLGLIPTFADHRTLLATYTSLFCFLLLGFVFYVRHTLARWMFPEACAGKASTPDTRVVARVGHALITAAPMLLIVASLGL